MTSANTGGEVPHVAPAITEDSLSFWTGGANGRLMIHCCNACGTYLHPPVPVCRACRSMDVAPRVVSGRGTVASFTVNHQPWSEEYVGPYVVGLVEIVEQPGVNLITNLVDCSVQDVHIGMSVCVAFRAVGEAMLPVFRPDN